MKRIVFLGVGKTCERAHYAKDHFDWLEEQGVKFMMSVHGQGRWPSSRVPIAMCDSILNLGEGKEELGEADRIVVMEDDEETLALNNEFGDKVEHWNIHGFEKVEIKKKVADLVDRVEHW